MNISMHCLVENLVPILFSYHQNPDSPTRLLLQIRSRRNEFPTIGFLIFYFYSIKARCLLILFENSSQILYFFSLTTSMFIYFYSVFFNKFSIIKFLNFYKFALNIKNIFLRKIFHAMNFNKHFALSRKIFNKFIYEKTFEEFV